MDNGSQRIDGFWDDGSHRAVLAVIGGIERSCGGESIDGRPTFQMKIEK